MQTLKKQFDSLMDDVNFNAHLFVSAAKGMTWDLLCTDKTKQQIEDEIARLAKDHAAKKKAYYG